VPIVFRAPRQAVQRVPETLSDSDAPDNSAIRYGFLDISVRVRHRAERPRDRPRNTYGPCKSLVVGSSFRDSRWECRWRDHSRDTCVMSWSISSGRVRPRVPSAALRRHPRIGRTPRGFSQPSSLCVPILGGCIGMRRLLRHGTVDRDLGRDSIGSGCRLSPRFGLDSGVQDRFRDVFTEGANT
jgi:hypothetical protein